MTNRPAGAPALAHALAEWLATTPAGLRPDLIADAAAEAVIVGLGMSTREAHEVFDVVTDTTWRLVERGFTTVAVLDNQRVADLYDRYVSGQDVDIDQALVQAWGPWQVGTTRSSRTCGSATAKPGSRSSARRRARRRIRSASPARTGPGHLCRAPGGGVTSTR
ncbi:hypothetical protein ACIODS_03205 [Micromonospora chalcea]|uniref:hypothetical protein n=1 Tax=Micromonospora chalcea TaxID=1874 RepID=UPI0038182A44